ncbi:hypothetical protein M408DRAFT_138654 [Serendipita vermifera MAFF 305830]|uniref:CP-type G domain-containing protein n=1 Tax=Serendipita vermifera MAFF 305830 TaxID=933852 RepID=A0A0C2W1I2_SERVB|nr:hypothetical protein M408DRAFT_138654 [Serendipita vermifera MAFF 305830]
MVRIRKKTSNRATTAHRAKVKNKARETKKKNKKDVKKNPHLHRKKKKKDPGIPNSFPYKEQILAELSESRRLAIEEKRNKGQSKHLNGTSGEQTESTGVNGASINTAITVTTNKGAAEEEEAPPLIDTTIPNTAAALQVADVVISVLDARDPLSFRSTFVEGTLGNTPLLYVLNKIELAPREAVASWAAHLRKSHPTFLFKSASTFLPLDSQNSKAKSKNKASDSDALRRDVLLEALQAIASANKQTQLTVAVVGVTNVGKSAFINSMYGQPALTVYSPLAQRDNSAPSTTPHPQSITLVHKKQSFKFIDTPGLSFIPPSDPGLMEDLETRVARDILLRNRGNISKIRDPLPAALYILSRATMEDLIMLYNLPAIQPGDYDGFLASLSRKEGALQKRGSIIDLQGAARALVRDWKTGRLAHYTLPSSTHPATPTSNTSQKPNLSSLFEKSDSRILSELLPRKDLRKQKNGLVQLKDATVDERRVDLEATVDLMDEDSSEDDAMALAEKMSDDEMDETDEDEETDDNEEDEEGDEDSNEDDSLSEGDSDEEDSELDEDEEDIPSLPVVHPKLSGKKGRDALRAQRGSGKEPLKSKKSVSFAPYTKAGMKSKPKKTVSPVAPTKSVPQTNAPPKKPVKAPKPAAGTSKALKTKAALTQEDGDAYDFSKYF